MSKSAKKNVFRPNPLNTLEDRAVPAAAGVVREQILASRMDRQAKPANVEPAPVNFAPTFKAFQYSQVRRASRPQIGYGVSQQIRAAVTTFTTSLKNLRAQYEADFLAAATPAEQTAVDNAFIADSDNLVSVLNNQIQGMLVTSPRAGSLAGRMNRLYDGGTGNDPASLRGYLIFDTVGGLADNGLVVRYVNGGPGTEFTATFDPTDTERFIVSLTNIVTAVQQSSLNDLKTFTLHPRTTF